MSPRIILERLAGGHTLQLIFSAFLDVTKALIFPSSPQTAAPNLQTFFTRLNTFLTHALTHPTYALSRHGARPAERLHDEFRVLLTLEANTRWDTDSAFWRIFPLEVCFSSPAYPCYNVH